jgi:hypothetical protein
MSIPRSWLNLTGWRAVGAAVVIVALFGIKAWNRIPHYRQFDSGTWEVPAGQSMVYRLSVKEDSKLRIEISPESSSEIAVYMLDAPNHNKLVAQESSQQSQEAIDTIFQRSSNRTIVVEDVPVPPGDYTLITENANDEAVKVNFNLSQFR